MIIHEQQVRQHCAIHTVNNLLQLPPTLVYDQEVVEVQQTATKGDVDGDDASHDEEKEAVVNNNDSDTSIYHEWTCHGKKIMQQRQWYTATQQEFDNIAIELTIREHHLLYSLGDVDNKIPGVTSNEEMTNEKNDDTTTTKHKLSFLQSVRSQYGTPYLGNYSIEVITKALQRRGVTLEYYRVPPTEECVNTNTKDNDYFAITSAAASSNNTATLVGFVVYTKVDMSQRSISNSLTMFGRHIPIIKNFCNIGHHHWYAITGIRYRDSMIPNDDGCLLNDDMNTNNNDDTTIWNCIDSKMSNVIPFHTDVKVMKYMRNVQQCEGGLIFRAYCINS